MNFRIFSFIIIMIILPFTVFAEPVKGFHTGPYMTLDFGVLQATDDRDQTIMEELGHPAEPLFGVTFGWNINDAWAIDSSLRYATNIDSTPLGRLHLFEPAIGARYSLIFNSLMKKKVKILPQLVGGFGARVAAYPVTRGDRSLRWGVGPYLGAGLMFLIGEYFYIGVDGRAEFFVFDETKKGSTVVYKGGFIPQGIGILHIGVHY